MRVEVKVFVNISAKYWFVICFLGFSRHMLDGTEMTLIVVVKGGEVDSILSGR